MIPKLCVGLLLLFAHFWVSANCLRDKHAIMHNKKGKVAVFGSNTHIVNPATSGHPAGQNSWDEPSETAQLGSTASEDYYRKQFLPLDAMNVLGLLVMALMLVIATLAGVGGNVVILPVCLIFFRFEPKIAIAHTSMFAMVSSLTRVLFEKAEERIINKPALSNYHIAMIAGPPSVLGAFLGTTMNALSPETVIIGVALGLQIYLLIYSIGKYQIKKEEERKKELLQPMIDKEEASVPISGQDGTLSKTLLDDKLARDTLGGGILTSQTTLQKTDMMMLAGFLVLNPLFIFLRGNRQISSVIGNEECSGLDFTLLIAYMLLLFGLCAFTRSYVLNQNANKQLAETDIEITGSYSDKYMATLTLLAFIGGFVSSGSSTLITICNIMFGLSPFIASSTSLIVVIIFSGSTAFIYYMNGLIYNSCMIIVGIVVIAATLATRMTIYQYFLKHGKGSVILLFISISMVLAIPANLMQVLPHIIQEHKEGKNIWAFNPFCKPK